MNGHDKDVHKTNFFRSYVLTKAKNTTTGMMMHSNERKYLVDSGNSQHMMGLSSLNHREKDHSTVNENPGYSDRQ